VEQYGGTGRRLERRERRQPFAEPGFAGRERKAAWDVRIWPVASGVAWRTLKNVFTNPSLFFPSLVFPLFFFTAFAGGLSQVSKVPGFDFPPGYTAFQFCFVLVQSAAFGGVFTGFGIARDFEFGFARRLLIAAPNRTGIVLGYALAAVARWAVTATVLTVVALLAGMNVFGGPVDVFGMYALALLVNIAGLLWACGIAMRFRTIQAGPLMQMPVFIVLFFAPVYVPLTLLTGWIEVSAKLNPLTYVLEAERSMLAGAEVHVALAFGLAIVLGAGFSLWALRGLRSAEAAG
jgi:ABC-2 type transport system permease protein